MDGREKVGVETSWMTEMEILAGLGSVFRCLRLGRRPPSFGRRAMSFTTPTYLATKAASSRSVDESRKRVISLYRQWQRAVRPWG